MATYGTALYKANGTTPLINQGLSGGSLYLDTVTLAVGTSATYTYPDVPGGAYLRVMLVKAGAHAYSIGTNGSGQATVAFTYYSGSGSSNQTIAFIFASQTTEPSYGVSLINDAGERLVSSLFSVPECIGVVTSTYVGGGSIGGVWSATSSVGAGRKRMILWKIPDTSYTSFQGEGYISEAVTGSYSVSCRQYQTSSETFAAPVAYIFALTGLATGSESYGIRVYTAGGAVTFDSGKQMLSLLKSQTYDFGTPVTVASMSGVAAAILLPSPTSQYGSSSSYFAGYDGITGEPLYGYIYTNYFGATRKNGTTLYSDYFYVDGGSGWTLNDYYNGQSTGLVTVVTDSSNYS